MDEKTLQSIEQRVVLFYDDELIATRAEDGQIYVSIRHLCQALGLDRYGQVQRIRRQSVLDDGHYQIEVDTGSGFQSTNMLRVDLVPLWLTGIRTSSVKDEIRDKLERYQREAAKVLWQAFQEGQLTADFSLDDLLDINSPAAQAYKMAMAVMQMAKQQLMLEVKMREHTARLDDQEKRLEEIETTLGDPKRVITPAQATNISQAVKAIAMELSRRSGRNEYGGVYGELYRHFQVPSYREIPARQYDRVIDWLRNWWSSMTDDADVPF